jgi:hypothetical protein
MSAEEERDGWIKIAAQYEERLTKALAEKSELLAAAKKLEEAEDFNANCDECEGEGVPELCEKCFPLFDDARVMRRIAIAKAEAA